MVLLRCTPAAFGTTGSSSRDAPNRPRTRSLSGRGEAVSPRTEDLRQEVAGLQKRLGKLGLPTDDAPPTQVPN